MKVVDFTLLDQEGIPRQLSTYQGQWIVLYFYPKDDTPGCTKEACTFQENIHEFINKNVTIIGISKDSVLSHKKFAQKYHLSFRLLSDPEKKVIKLYNAWGEKKFMGKTFEGVRRMTYLINPAFEIIKIYEKVHPLTHAREILSMIKP